jgi:hypothetical protein
MTPETRALLREAAACADAHGEHDLRNRCLAAIPRITSDGHDDYVEVYTPTDAQPARFDLSEP